MSSDTNPPTSKDGGDKSTTTNPSSASSTAGAARPLAPRNSQPTQIEVEQPAAARKRDRDSQFGPTTPSSEDANFHSGNEAGNNSGTTHAAKKNRVLSRDNSAPRLAADASLRPADTARHSADDDLDITPPGTPVVSSLNKSQGSLSATASPAIGNLPLGAGGNDATPPASPLISTKLHPSGMDTTASTPMTAPETSKVKEMRERVQEMTTGEEDNGPSINDAHEAPSSGSAPSSPAATVEAEIAKLPGSAAEAEAEKVQGGSHKGGPVVTQPEVVTDSQKTATNTQGEMLEDLPPSQPLTKPAVQALGRASSLMPPPSPASSIRAETGSNAGDSDQASERPPPSRMSSMSSMRSVHVTHSHTGSASSSHLQLHSALPRSETSSVDINSDALSDISTDVAPPETPRPVKDIENAPSAPPTPLAHVAGAAPVEAEGTEPPPPTPAVADGGKKTADDDQRSASPAGPSTTTTMTGAGMPAVQANFGRPTSSFGGSGSTTASPGAAKPFVNPFSSFGAAKSSPFASSPSSSPFGSASTSKVTNPSNLGTAKPFGASPSASPFGFTSGASPFASAGASGSNQKSAFENKPAAEKESEDEEQTEDVDRAAEIAHGDDEKIFSSQNEVHMLTGEEDEVTQTTIPRAKLYVMDGNEWKERGVGQLRLNSKRDYSGSESKISVRLVMRSEAVLRLILNVSLFPGMSVTLAQDKFVRLSAFEDEKLKHFTIRVANAGLGRELYDSIKECLEMLPQTGSGKSASAASAV